MAVPDISQGANSINSNIEAINTYVQVSKSEKKLKKDTANSATKSVNNLSSQLNKIAEKQKRYQRDPPTSLDQLVGMIGKTKGNGSESIKYLRKKVLEVASKIEPQLQSILKEQSVKAIGCSQEQTYVGISASSLALQPLPLQPQQQGIYIPVSSVDLFSNLKSSPTTPFGEIYYEKPDPSANQKFKPYGGDVSFPMNKQLYQLMQNTGSSYSQINGKNYLGKSGQNLFDIQYTNANSFGVTGDYYRVALINREDNLGNPSNKVGEFINDYYSTINLIDSVDIGAQLVNILTGSLDIKSALGPNQIENSSKFYLIAQRILGLCFDDRREIDVSGVAKIAELDGVDDTFFELNEVDLRNLDIRVTNIQNGVTEFEDCNNVKLPVNYEVQVDELINFRNTQSGQTEEQKVATLEKIIDSISQNPDWKLLVPGNFNVDISINKDILKKIPLAIAAGVLTPKVLLPLYAILSVVQSGSTYTYNQAITNTNTITSSGNATGQQGSNVIISATDFLKKFKTFCIEVISKINEIFLKTLFDILKKDIINLISIVLSDIANSKRLKKYAIILKLVNIALVVGQLLQDYRKCKSLLSSILVLLNLINGIGAKPLIGSRNEIPLPLLFLTKLLPGTSPERATINTIQGLQSLGIPTGTLPDGSPNLMLLYNLATHRGADKENAENGKIEAVGIVPPITGGIIQITGKNI